MAEDNLIAQLKREKNIFTVASLVEALGKINSQKALQIIQEWLEINAEEIVANKNFFVLKHFRNALIKLDSKNALKEFDDKYFELLLRNNTI